MNIIYIINILTNTLNLILKTHSDCIILGKVSFEGYGMTPFFPPSNEVNKFKMFLPFFFVVLCIFVCK